MAGRGSTRRGSVQRERAAMTAIPRATATRSRRPSSSRPSSPTSATTSAARCWRAPSRWRRRATASSSSTSATSRRSASSAGGDRAGRDPQPAEGLGLFAIRKGLFAARKAIMHYTQQKHIARRDASTTSIIGNGASELIVMAMQALLNNGDEVLVPAPDYPLWTAAVSLAGGTPRHYLCDEAAGWLPDLDDIRAQDHAAHARHRGHQSEQPDRRAVSRRRCCSEIVEIARAARADRLRRRDLRQGALRRRARTPRSRRWPTTCCSSPSTACRRTTAPAATAPAGWSSRASKRHAQRLHRGPEHAGLDAPVRQRAGRSTRSRPRSAATRASTTWSRPAGGCARQRDLAYELLTAIPGVTCVKPKAALYLFPRLDPKMLSDRRRPGVHPRSAAGGEGAGGAGHRLQLAEARSLPRRVPARRRPAHRGDRPHRALPRSLPPAARRVTGAARVSPQRRSW